MQTPPAPELDAFTPATKPTTPDRWGRYLLPDPVTGKLSPWTRATTVARTLADEYNLTRWKVRTACRGLALRPDLIALAASLDPDADKGKLDELAESALERGGHGAAANLGTALHAFTHRMNRGEHIESLGVPVPLDSDLRAYAEEMRAQRLGILPDYMERIGVNYALSIAGRFDNIVSQPPGNAKAAPLAVLDLKTGKDLSYSWLEISIQLAIYANAEALWDERAEVYEAMPAEVDKDRALVLHLPVGRAKATLYAVNIAKGWEYVQTAMLVRRIRSSAKDLAWLVKPDPEDLALQRVRRATSREQLASLWEALTSTGQWTEEVNAAAQQRLADLEAITIES